ncbi:MAG: hypothetical protein ACRDJO_09260 [Actinomycetota bacterium]
MVEATKQAERAEKVVRSWTDTQMKVWQSWVDTMQASTAGKSTVWEQTRKATIDSLEKSVLRTLEAQAELSHVLAESVAGMWVDPGDPAAEKARVAELDAITKTATEAHRQLWAAWFDLARQVPVWEIGDGYQKIVDAWQEAARKAVEAQARWYDAGARERGGAAKTT